MIELGGVQTNSWLDRQWSEWVALDAALQRGKGPPRQSGVYRIRDAHDTVSLLYVGESGNIRGRLFQLRNAMRKVAKGGKQGSPHWAGASILYYQRTGAIIEISWLLDAVDDKGERKGIECECIAAHRWLLNTNPACQFIALERRTDG
jgi:hypothetical protein